MIAGGVVSGTWSVSSDGIVVDWFEEAAAPDRELLTGEVERISLLLGLRGNDIR